jgi:FKBP-type peptidyl-prolyl cis-trans isomerase (trigger factor)
MTARLLDKNIDGLRHSYRIALDEHEIARSASSRLRALGRRARIPGFRPGRAPIRVLEAHHGREARQAVIEQMALGTARQIIAEHGLDPVRRPVVRHPEQDGLHAPDVEVVVEIEVAPRVELGALKGLTLERLRPRDPDPELMEQAQAHLRRQLFDALMARYDFTVPVELVNEEYARIEHGYHAEVGEAVDEVLAGELRMIAERRVRLAILFTEVGRAHGISVGRDELEALVRRRAERDPEHREALIAYYVEHPTALAELQAPLFEERVVDYLLSISEVEDVSVSREELLAAVRP